MYWAVLLLLFTSSIQTQGMAAEITSCTDPAGPHFENALHVIWNKTSAKVVCMENFMYVGSLPSAICNKSNRWKYEGKCLQHQWISPKFDSFFPLIFPLTALGQFTFCADVTPGIPTLFTITVSNKAKTTFIVIRVVFRALIDGVHHTNQVFIHTVDAGQTSAQVQFNQSFPFTVGKKAQIKLVPESDVKLGIFVNGAKLISYDSPTPLSVLTHVHISHESTVNSANVFCQICDIKSAPKFLNTEVTWWTERWPPHGIIRCMGRNIIWRGSTPARATCVRDIWSTNGQCLPRFIYNAVPGQVYTLPRVVDAGHQVSVKGKPLAETGFSLVFTRQKEEAVTYTIHFEKKGKLYINESTNELSFGEVPLVVGQPFIIRLKIAKDDEIDALVEKQDSVLVFMTSLPLTGPEGVTGFGVKGHVAASLIDLQYDLEHTNWSLPKRMGRVRACSAAPLIAYGKVTLRNESYELAEVTCNKNFVWGTEGPSVVTCDRSSGWQVNGTCNQAVWSNKLKPGSNTYPLPLVMRIGHEICISAKVGTNRSLDITFGKGKDVLFYLKISFENKIEGTPIIGDKEGQKQNYSTDWSIPQNGIMFIKVKVTSETELEFQLSPFHNYKFNISSRVKDINNIAVLMSILKIDLACHLHLHTFCSKDLVPSVNNGTLLWVPSHVSAQSLMIRVTCNNNFAVVEDTDGFCDPKVGWLVTGQCRPRTNFLWEIKQSKIGLKLVPTLVLGQKICLAVDTQAVKSKRSRIKMRTQNREVAYAFMYDTSSYIWTSQTVEGASVNSMSRCNFINFEEKQQFFINLTMIQNHMIVMTVGESAESCTSTSLTSIDHLGYIDSDFPIRSINMDCEAPDVNPENKDVCSKSNAPILKQATTMWTFYKDRAKATIECQPGFVWSGARRPLAFCDKWVGWTSDGDCIPKRWNSFDMSEYPEGVPIRRVRNGQSICFNIPVTTTSTPTITISSYSEVMMIITVDAWQKKLSRKGELARKTSNGEGIPITLTAIADTHYLVQLGEEYFVVQSEADLYFVRFMKTNFKLLDVNVECERQS